LLAAAFATATALIGQTAPVPANPKAEAKDNAIKLSPFEVRNEKDQGYVATSTLAGTRLNTPLRDTPVAISVFTEEFLKQIDAVTVVDVLKFAIGVEPSYDSTGNVRSGSDVVVNIRGLGRSTMARNYFVWSNQASDSYIIGSLTFTRGPDNVLFGRSGPQGSFNADTKRASFGRNGTVSPPQIQFPSNSLTPRWPSANCVAGAAGYAGSRANTHPRCSRPW
jgi:outer membrane receptor protein involved in Fe transport